MPSGTLSQRAGALSRKAGAISQREARWAALAAQGLSTPRPSPKVRAVGRAGLRRVMERLSVVQLDAVNVLARTQFLVPFSRLGAYEPAALRSFSGPGGQWFEYWGHAASLMSVEHHPLFRWRMQRLREDRVDSAVAQERRRAWRAAHAGYLASVLAEVTEKGPLAASQLSEPRRQSGEWWDRRSTGRRALELLFGDGALAAWRSANFERIYDLTERVVPASVLALPTPSAEEAQRELVVLAAKSLGVATLADLADYFWLRPTAARQRTLELVEQGRLVEVRVADWAQPAFSLPGLSPRPPRRPGATLLSPFDSLIWTRDRVKRLFDFHYRIEIYVPGPQRSHGYYVMPLLLGDDLVGRLDLKADRQGQALKVVAGFAEPGYGTPAVGQAALAELHRLREWLGLEKLQVGERGDLAAILRSLASAPKRRGKDPG